MRVRVWTFVVLSAVLAILPEGAEQGLRARPAGEMVEGVWRLERIVRAAGVVETKGGFIFQGGYYSTTVNYSDQGSQMNISQFGTYSLEGNLLSLLPSVQISTRAQTVSYEPEPPFSMDVTVTGDEMKGVVVKDGTTFFFRRLR